MSRTKLTKLIGIRLSAVSAMLVTSGIALSSQEVVSTASAKASVSASESSLSRATRHKYVTVRDLKIFYREAGRENAPVLLLLHGFPTSSQMFRNLIPKLAEKYHVIAPDYPGFGYSSAPARSEFEYTFNNIAAVVDEFTEQLGLSRFSMYVQDYGAPIGFRIASEHPERIAGIIVQNGNAYNEGIDNDFWKPIKEYWANPNALSSRKALEGLLTFDATKWQYTHGVPSPEVIDPDAATLDQLRLDRPGLKDIQLDLFLSYGSNPPLYPKWQAYFRKHQPPMLIVWGKNDVIFPAAGATPYLRDLPKAELYLVDAGHFILESDFDFTAGKIFGFLDGINN
jgi:pimeloyl-ACP methyl ester carboxylesterase